MDILYKNKTTKIEIDEEKIYIIFKNQGLIIKMEDLIYLMSKLIIEHPKLS